MRRTIRLYSQCLLLALATSLGCAPAYRQYDSCYVHCRYAAPRPLPYIHYDGCACHSCAASKYLQGEHQMESFAAKGLELYGP